MLYIRQFSIILLFYLVGEGIAYLLPFDFPGSLIGMGLLFLALSSGAIRLHDIKEVSDFFLKHMALFFIPAGVSVMNSFELIEDQLLQIITVLILSTLFMLAFIALVVEYFLKRLNDV